MQLRWRAPRGSVPSPFAHDPIKRTDNHSVILVDDGTITVPSPMQMRELMSAQTMEPAFIQNWRPWGTAVKVHAGNIAADNTN